MTFESIQFEDGVLRVKAVGHPTEVVEHFYNIAALALTDHGPWRITEVYGSINQDDTLDSDMKWTLAARSKYV